MTILVPTLLVIRISLDNTGIDKNDHSSQVPDRRSSSAQVTLIDDQVAATSGASNCGPVDDVANANSSNISDIVPGDDILSGKYPILTYTKDFNIAPTFQPLLQASNAPVFNESVV